MTDDIRDFYDGLAADYHLVYGDRWDQAVTLQGAALARLIRSERPRAQDVLDCSCGIGTQAIGLALQGFRVTGTDLSPLSVQRAGAESERFGAALNVSVADFRELDEWRQDFDVVLSADNALPHLLTDDDLSRALLAMRGCLRQGGLLVLSLRDYDHALADRPPAAMPVLIQGPPRRVVVRLHDWDAPTSDLYTVRFLVCTEDGETGWTIAEHHARYRAITRAALTALLDTAGYRDVMWRSGDEVGFHQPVVTATSRS